MKTYAPYIAIALLILIAGYFYIEWTTARHEADRKQSALDEKNDSISYWKNGYGQQVAEKTVAQLEAKEIREAYPKLADDIEKKFDIKLKKVLAVIYNEFEARGTGEGLITNNHYYDSSSRKQVRFRDFNMDDGYLKFNTRLYDSLSNALYTYSYRDTATTVFHSDKKWWQIFKPEHYLASTVFNNPNAKLTGTTNIMVKGYREKRFGIGPSVGYDPFRNEWNVSVSIHYDLIKF
jgi:hypothetical protein